MTHTIQLSSTTYQRLINKAQDEKTTPDQIADSLLSQTLAPKHAYVETVNRVSGPQAVIKGTRVAISMIIGYLHLGETPESIANEILPHLDLAQIYDALSYYYDHQAQIDEEISQNSVNQNFHQSQSQFRFQLALGERRSGPMSGCGQYLLRS